MINAFEAKYQDEEPGERSGGWEVVQWDWIALDGGVKSGHRVSNHYGDEEGCVKEAARLNRALG